MTVVVVPSELASSCGPFRGGKVVNVSAVCATFDDGGGSSMDVSIGDRMKCMKRFNGGWSAS